jgi:high-affinity nickel-transport protein
MDADHIAAIDNVTRRLMQAGKRPVAVGFFFALGHSAVVLLVTGLVASAAELLSGFDSFKVIGGVISTAVSATFLLAVAVMNTFILSAIYKTYRHVRRGGPYVEADLDFLLNSRGILTRAVRPVFALITRSWHMLPLGILFGLGFDTATEVAMFGMAATQTTGGMSLPSVMALPVLFAAGMSLVDTTDGVLMLGVYDWAFVTPLRKLRYSLAITLTSIFVALFVGSIEVMGLVIRGLGLTRGLWHAIHMLGENFNALGILIVCTCILAWMISFVISKAGWPARLSIGRANRPGVGSHSRFDVHSMGESYRD